MDSAAIDAAAYWAYRRDLAAAIRRAILMGELGPVNDTLIAHDNTEALAIHDETVRWAGIHRAVCEMREMADLHASSAAWLAAHGFAAPE